MPAAVEPAAPARPRVDPLPARRIGRDDRIRLAARLERHFRRPEDVRRLAAAVGVGRDLADRPADGMWAEVLERAERGDRDLAPLVEALLVADPEDALTLRLSRAPVPA
ncbi:hypothetical protein L6R50_10690 [Myxococcota bacterium]|nr:hypothetical protein [Myxococcota bacterium]